jgi:hypothetical protein
LPAAGWWQTGDENTGPKAAGMALYFRSVAPQTAFI